MTANSSVKRKNQNIYAALLTPMSWPFLVIEIFSYTCLFSTQALIVMVSGSYKTMVLLLPSIFAFVFSADAATTSTETDVRERQLSPNSAGSFSPISPTPAAVSRNSSCYSLNPYLGNHYSHCTGQTLNDIYPCT